MASPLAEYVVSLGSDGHIASHGSVSAVLSSDVALAKEVEREKEQELLEEDSDEADAEEAKDGKEKKDGKLVVAEEIELGRVSRKSCESCFKLSTWSTDNGCCSPAVVRKPRGRPILVAIRRWIDHNRVL